MTDETYTLCHLILKAKTSKAILVVPVENPDGKPVWIARSCVSAADERHLEENKKEDVITIKIFTWLAKKENLF